MRYDAEIHHNTPLDTTMPKKKRSKHAIHLACHKVAVGNLVIINDVDRPCESLICVVTHATPTRVIAHYLSDNRECRSTKPETVTPILKFGLLAVKDNDGKIWLDKVCPSTATYPDGALRHWQGDLSPITPHTLAATKILESSTSTVENKDSSDESLSIVESEITS